MPYISATNGGHKEEETIGAIRRATITKHILVTTGFRSDMRNNISRPEGLKSVFRGSEEPGHVSEFKVTERKREFSNC